MQVNKELFEEICDSAGEEKIKRAKRYIDEGRVNIIKADYQNANNFNLTSRVAGHYDEYEVNIEVKKGELEVAYCECPDYQNHYCACKHIVATLMKFEKTKFWDNEHEELPKEISKNKNNKFKYKTFNNLINSFYNEELKELSPDETVKLPEKQKIKIEPKIEYDKFSSRTKARV